jgi:hypothetical protein
MSAGQIALWHALVRIANKSGWADWITVAGCTICQHTGLSLTGVKKARNELKQRGLIEFKPQGTKATRYHVVDIAKSVQVRDQVGDQIGDRVGDQVGVALKDNKPKQKTPSIPQGQNLSPLEERFERFWKAYPNKTGKGAARKSWQRIRPSEDLLKQMLDALAAQKLSAKWQTEGGRFIPHPSTWLNQERWEDEVGGGGGEAAPPPVEEDVY